tara:strand:- start:10403 stop:11440 length:1038 start_codon:yes stop_codon:yes gene_type:complete
MALQSADYDDLVLSTLADLGRGEWTDLTTDLADHVAARELLVKNRVKIDSGENIRLNAQTSHGNEASHVGLYAEDDVAVGNTMDQGSIPWRHTTTNWAYDRRELAMNRRPARILSMVEEKRSSSWAALAQLMEETFWDKPDDSADTTTPYGIDYWLVYNATVGFNGSLPSGFTTVGGIDSDTVTRWKNYTGNYVNVARDDLIQTMRTACRKTAFKAPPRVNHKQPTNGSTKRVIYCNDTSCQAFENYGEAQNENLGKDLASMADVVTFKRIPIEYAEQLDANTNLTDPIYCIDWSVFYPVFLEGEYLVETGPKQAAKQHTVSEVHVDMTWNLRCTNRRKLSVFAK